jgi:hypothetical protein
VYADPDDNGNEYRCFILDPEQPDDFFITALAPVVDQDSIVHHAVLLLKDRAELTPQEQDPSGYDCMGGTDLDASGDTVVAWAPGMLPVELPDDTGIRVGADQVLILQIHYFASPGSDGVADQSGYAFRTTDAVSTLAMTRQAGIADFEIPPGDDAYARTARYTPRFDEEVLGVFPHMHTLGSRFHASVQDVDGAETCLVEGPYDFDNQLTYQFATAVPLGPDDVLEYTCEWNNSSSNPEITGEPVPTSFGERTDEEMCIFFLLVRELGEAGGPVVAEPVDPTSLPPGGFQVNFASDAAGTFAADACVGELEVSGEPPLVDGTGTCTFSSVFAGIFGPDPQPVSVSGDPTGGTLFVDLPDSPLETPWTATLSGTSVYATFDGTVVVSTGLGQAPVSFAGAFQIDAAP